MKHWMKASWEMKILPCISWKIILWNNSSYTRCLAGYPYKPPKLYLKAKEGLSDDDLQALHSLLIDQVRISQVAFLNYSRMNHSAPNAHTDEYNNGKSHVIIDILAYWAYSWMKLLFLQAASISREGRVMIYNLVEAAQEFLSEHVRIDLQQAHEVSTQPNVKASWCIVPV